MTCITEIADEKTIKIFRLSGVLHSPSQPVVKVNFFLIILALFSPGIQYGRKKKANQQSYVN